MRELLEPGGKIQSAGHRLSSGSGCSGRSKLLSIGRVAQVDETLDDFRGHLSWLVGSGGRLKPRAAWIRPTVKLLVVMNVIPAAAKESACRTDLWGA